MSIIGNQCRQDTGRSKCGMRVGDALQDAKEAMQINGNAGLQEISDTFGLIGDPSAKIVRPETVIASVNE